MKSYKLHIAIACFLIAFVATGKTFASGPGHRGNINRYADWGTHESYRAYNDEAGAKRMKKYRKSDKKLRKIVYSTSQLNVDIMKIETKLTTRSPRVNIFDKAGLCFKFLYDKAHICCKKMHESIKYHELDELK